MLGIGRENQIFLLRTPATVKFFHQIVKNDMGVSWGVLDTPMMPLVMGASSAHMPPVMPP